MKKGRTLAIGDIHGAYKALMQCLERCGFDYQNDTLIPLGDIADGWAEVNHCISALLLIPNLIPIMGNHDHRLKRFIETGRHPIFWAQGGHATMASYLSKNSTTFKPNDIPKSHQLFLKQQRLYYIDESFRCFVHGGFDRRYPFHLQPVTNEYNPGSQIYFWDRTLWFKAQCVRKGRKLKLQDPFSEVYIGHTAVNKKKNRIDPKPLYRGGVWNLDTGAGWEGKLTIMDVDTHLYWQSDFVRTLYPQGHNTR